MSRYSFAQLAKLSSGWWLGVLLAMLGGCQSATSLDSAKAVDLPTSFLHAQTTEKQPVQRVGAQATSWWHAYASLELNRLVSQALSGNPDLRLARSQLAQAKIRAEQVAAGGLPTLTAPLRAALGSGSGGEALQNSQAGLQASYRIDLWGEQSAQKQSADQSVWRATYEHDNFQRTLVGSIVSTYISYLSLSDSLAIADENERISRDMLGTVERRLAAGDATLDDLERQRAVVYQQQAVRPGLKNQRDDLHNVLSRLLGVLPSELEITGGTVEQLSAPSLHAGLPSHLLFNRPDIRGVEARMRSAQANIAVARARLLPPVDLAVQGGYNGLGLGQLLQPQNIFWNSVASLAVTIFDGGRRAADTALAQAAYEDMVITYGQTVYQAVREVESALSGLRAAQQRLEAQQLGHRSALNAFKISSDAYALGALDLGSLLDARRAYQRNLEEQQRSKADMLRAYAALSQALGGSGQADAVALATTNLSQIGH